MHYGLYSEFERMQQVALDLQVCSTHCYPYCDSDLLKDPKRFSSDKMRDVLRELIEKDSLKMV